MFAWALRKGHVQRNPFADAEIPRQQQAKRSPRLMPDEKSKLLHAATPRIYRLIVGALETGCGLGELLALRWQDVDSDRREIRVTAEHAKDAEGRLLPMSARLAAVLELARLDPTGHDLPSDAYVFGDEVGRPVTTFKKAWQVTCSERPGINRSGRRAGSRMRAGSGSPKSISTFTTCATRRDRDGSKAVAQRDVTERDDEPLGEEEVLSTELCSWRGRRDSNPRPPA